MAGCDGRQKTREYYKEFAKKLPKDVVILTPCVLRYHKCCCNVSILNGNTIIEDVTNALTYEEVYGSERNLWSVLLMTGYVTKAKQEESDAADDEEGVREVELRIPNREIAKLFQKTVADHFRNSVDKSHIKELVLALWKGDEETASTVLSDLLFQTISYMDYHEDYYHAFIAGVFAGYGYVPKSNRERGLGRFDVTIKETANRRILFIETKKSDSYERMDFWCDKAIEQIIEKQYAKDVHGSHEVLCYGISFFEKSAKVKLMSNRLKLKRLENDHHL